MSKEVSEAGINTEKVLGIEREMRQISTVGIGHDGTGCGGGIGHGHGT